jgi:voltage-gated potassium channel
MYHIRSLSIFNRLIFPILLLVGLIGFGISGYMIIERYTFLEAIYMTVITIASVGFEEVHQLSRAGMIFTIVLILINLATFTLFITMITRYIADGDFLKQYKYFKMHNRLEKLNSHVIICGFGRNGREAAQVLSENQIPYVIIELNESLTDISILPEHLINGNATKDEILRDAGIQKATALITTLPNDADNLFVVLTARQQNPSLKIISRASLDTSVEKLKIAGATNVIMPDKLGGSHMATLVMHPDILEMVSLMTTRNNAFFKIEELTVRTRNTLGEMDIWKKTGTTVLGIKKKNDYLLNPPPEYNLSPGESVIVMGSELQISRARELI